MRMVRGEDVRDDNLLHREEGADALLGQAGAEVVAQEIHPRCRAKDSDREGRMLTRKIIEPSGVCMTWANAVGRV